jgi:hypothetical protein
MLYPLGAEGVGSLKTTVFSAITLGADRTSVIVNKGGRNQVAIDLRVTQGGGSFDANGVFKILAGDNAALVEADALASPESPVISAEGTVKLELKTGYPFIAVFWDYNSGGADDTVTGTITVS